MTGLLRGNTPKFWPKVTHPPVDLSVWFWVGLSGTADRTALFTVRTNPRWRPPPCWKNFKWRYLRNRLSNPLMFCCRVAFSGTADLMALLPVRTNPRWRPPPCWKNFKWPYLRNRSSDPLHVCYSVGFSGTADLMALFSIRTNSRWRRPPSWIISNGHISATAHDLLI